VLQKVNAGTIFVDMTIQSLDTRLLLFINHGSANAVFDVLMPALSSQGFLLVLPFLLYMVIRSVNQTSIQGKGYLKAALWTIAISCCAVYLGVRAEDVLKLAIARERPCRAIEGIRLITTCPRSYSLPSGHAISSFAFAIPLFLLSRDYLTMLWRIYPIVLASLIAFSRIYLGVHYPTDVIAGTVLGAGIGILLSILWRRIAIKHNTGGDTTPGS
jgi:undecaprenyl-diphosphatase